MNDVNLKMNFEVDEAAKNLGRIETALRSAEVAADRLANVLERLGTIKHGGFKMTIVGDVATIEVGPTDGVDKSVI